MKPRGSLSCLKLWKRMIVVLMCQALVLAHLVPIQRECFPIKGCATGEVLHMLRIVQALFIPGVNSQLVIVLFGLRLFVAESTYDFLEAIHPPIESLIRVQIRKECFLGQLLKLREFLDESLFFPFGLLTDASNFLISIVVGGRHIALSCFLGS